MSHRRAQGLQEIVVICTNALNKGSDALLVTTSLRHRPANRAPQDDRHSRPDAAGGGRASHRRARQPRRLRQIGAGGRIAENRRQDAVAEAELARIFNKSLSRPIQDSPSVGGGGFARDGIVGSERHWLTMARKAAAGMGSRTCAWARRRGAA